jgi:hypothetical protein
MLTTLHCGLVVAAVLVLPAWSSAEPLSGSGEWQSLSGQAIKGTWTASITRDGGLVDGSLTLKGSNVFGGGAVTGDINTSSIMLGVMAQGTKQATFTGKIDGDKISGEWQCEALKDHGVWWGSLVPVKQEDLAP